MRFTGRAAIWSLALALLLALLAMAAHLRLLAPMDREAHGWVRDVASPTLDLFMSALTMAGESVVTTGAALALSALLLITRGPKAAGAPLLMLLVFPMLALARLVVFQPLPEEGFGRARIGFQATRPLDQTDFALREAFARATGAMAGEAARPSTFPSGHAARLVFLALLAVRLVAGARPRWVRFSLYTVAALLILLMGWNRLYFGYHWASDVIGGYLAGAFLLALATPLLGGARSRPEPATGGRPPNLMS